MRSVQAGKTARRQCIRLTTWAACCLAGLGTPGCGAADAAITPSAATPRRPTRQSTAQPIFLNRKGVQCIEF